jgi:CRP/FNR family transcriptional regulator, cyclic AMP receptor protein
MSLPQKATLELIEGNPKVAIATVAFLCSRLRETDLRLEAIALHRIEVRLTRLLLSALRLESRGAQGSNIPLSLGISQGEVGLLIGASRPKVNAAFTLLQSAGAIARKGTMLACDTNILQSIADTE